jgi:hypothetical protein
MRATPTALLFLLWRPFRTFIVEKYAPTDVLFGFVKYKVCYPLIFVGHI